MDSTNVKQTASSLSFIMAPVVFVLMALSFNAKADSKTQLNGCIKKVYSTASVSNLETKDLTKAVSAGIKECRQSVKSMVKAERASKKRSKLEAQLKKLQAKLGTL